MRIKVLNAILIIFLATASLFYCGATQAQTSQIYEYYNTGDDAGNGLYSYFWYGQTFNTTYSHTIDTLRLRLYKVGTAGTLYAAIRACNTSTGLPEGSDLTNGAYDGSLLVTNTSGTFREISLTEYTLSANTQYAIVCYGTGADASNGIFWRSDNTSPAYTGGYYINSSNDGITWSSNASRDFMFELYGEPALDIVGVQAYEGYLEDNDWLFVINYICEVPPYYPSSSSQTYWQLQLLDGGTLISSLPVKQWGQRPGSIYLSADAVSSLEWGNDYTIRIYGNYGAYPNDSYTMTASDWMGDVWSQLDTWCINLAHTMEDRDGEEYLTESENADVLNTAGGAIFTIGIPYLPETRPGIFQYVVSTLDYTETNWDNTYVNSLDEWDSWMGPEVTDLANKAGSMMHLSGEWALGLGMFLVYMFFAGFGIFTGRITEGLVIGAPFLLLAMNWKIIPMALVATGIMILIYKWIKKEYFEQT